MTPHQFIYYGKLLYKDCDCGEDTLVTSLQVAGFLVDGRDHVLQLHQPTLKQGQHRHHVLRHLLALSQRVFQRREVAHLLQIRVHYYSLIVYMYTSALFYIASLSVSRDY